MTFTEISEIAGFRLSELISSPTLEAVCSCLGISNGGNASQIFEIIKQEISKSRSQIFC